ncbi:hypothetical protein CWB96_12995 [Pseudoalteromonas citrea]|uniref:Uncharacterized protein n=1 Tax=Pseudoalteromonas citrea TaxID=43655 RepID=A0A5S3XQ04_9GAMM|nr:hypothetical protein [Pseudoalteromonas citrea]TMP46403.1 hypothetical protein CWB97_01980 [Pseudoalteromonas citrea]TMP57875.1 hypothetical protein CWB96_12995 [Pseudoalteromonas citrea]
MQLLIKINSGLIAPQLLDDISTFENQSVVIIENESYLLSNYVGTKTIPSDYDVNKYINSQNTELLSIALTNTTVTSPSAQLIGNIWWLPKDEPFTITANAEGLPDGGLMVMVERVINATQPVDDIRFVANIQNGQITMQGKFEQSGNYIITAERLNAGLERIGAPFRLAFDTLELDAYVDPAN